METNKDLDLITILLNLILLLEILLKLILLSGILLYFGLNDGLIASVVYITGFL